MIKEALATAPRERISAAVRAAAATGRPALVGFLTAGFPSRRGFKENLAAVAAECDVVEIGVPFTDPMADGTARRADPPVPRSAASRIMSRTMNAIRGSITDCGTDGLRCSTVRPLASSMRVIRSPGFRPAR